MGFPKLSYLYIHNENKMHLIKPGFIWDLCCQETDDYQMMLTSMDIFSTIRKECASESEVKNRQL